MAGTYAKYSAAGGGGGGGGTVTSVTASGPLTSSGGAAPNIAFGSQAANLVLAGPTSGGSAAPSFRALVAGDLPSLSYANTNLSNLTSTAINASLTPATTETIDLGDSTHRFTTGYFKDLFARLTLTVGTTNPGEAGSITIAEGNNNIPSLRFGATGGFTGINTGGGLFNFINNNTTFMFAAGDGVTFTTYNYWGWQGDLSLGVNVKRFGYDSGGGYGRVTQASMGALALSHPNNGGTLLVRGFQDVTQYSSPNGGAPTTTINASTTLTLSPGGQFVNDLAPGDQVSVSSAPSTYSVVASVTDQNTIQLVTPIGNGTSQSVNVRRSICRMEDRNANRVFFIDPAGTVTVDNTLNTNKVLAAAGSAAAPSHSFQTDTATGLFLSAGGSGHQIRASNNGSTSLIIDTDLQQGVTISTTGTYEYNRSVNTGSSRFEGGVGPTSGYLMAYGSTHATKPAFVEVGSGGSVAVTFTGAQDANFVGNIASVTIGKGLQVRAGSNAKIGQATLVAGTVTVSNTSITAGSRIFLSTSTVGGTQGFLSYTKSVGTSFTINSSSGTDTSTIDWLIIESL